MIDCMNKRCLKAFESKYLVLLKSRFLSKVEKAGSCWNWLGYIEKEGYGACSVKGVMWKAHRVSFELFKNEIPEGFQIDHLCRNRKCVNPEHLDAVTPKINVLRSNAPTAVNARRTHCRRGHELRGENLHVTTIGGRRCKACHRVVKKRHRLARRNSIQIVA